MSVSYTHLDQLQTEIPVNVRLTGTNENIGRKLLKDSNRFQVAETMNEATLMVIKSVKGVLKIQKSFTTLQVGALRTLVSMTKVM